VWNGRDDTGKKVSPGIYLCNMVAEDFNKTIKIILTK